MNVILTDYPFFIFPSVFYNVYIINDIVKISYDKAFSNAV